MKRRDVLKGLAALPFLPAASRAFAALGDLQEAPFFAEKVANGELPPLAERLPKVPLVVDLPARGRSHREARRRDDDADLARPRHPLSHGQRVYAARRL